MKECLAKLGILNEAVALLEKGGQPDFTTTAAAAGYLRGELEGMKFTFEHLHLGQ